MQSRQEDHNSFSAEEETLKPLLKPATSRDANTGEASASGGLPFRLIADFRVRADPSRAFPQQNTLTEQQRRLFTTIVINLAVFKRMCRMAIVSDFEAYPWDHYFEGVFAGPDSQDILATAFSELSGADQIYWMQLQQKSPYQLDNDLFSIFEQFRASLGNVVIQDPATGETISLRVRKSKGGFSDVGIIPFPGCD
jgi:hypothetical protein